MSSVSFYIGADSADSSTCTDGTVCGKPADAPLCANDQLRNITYCCYPEYACTFVTNQNSACQGSNGAPSSSQISCQADGVDWCCLRDAQSCTQRTSQFNVCWAQSFDNPWDHYSKEEAVSVRNQILSQDPSATSIPFPSSLVTVPPTSTATAGPSGSSTPTSSPGSSSSLSGGAIAGIAVGAVVGIILFGLIAFFLGRRAKRQRNHDESRSFGYSNKNGDSTTPSWGNANSDYANSAYANGTYTTSSYGDQRTIHSELEDSQRHELHQSAVMAELPARGVAEFYKPADEMGSLNSPSEPKSDGVVSA